MSTLVEYGDGYVVAAKPRVTASNGFLCDKPVKRLTKKSAFLRKLEKLQRGAEPTVTYTYVSGPAVTHALPDADCVAATLAMNAAYNEALKASMVYTGEAPEPAYVHRTYGTAKLTLVKS